MLKSIPPANKCQINLNKNEKDKNILEVERKVSSEGHPRISVGLRCSNEWYLIN